MYDHIFSSHFYLFSISHNHYSLFSHALHSTARSLTQDSLDKHTVSSACQAQLHFLPCTRNRFSHCRGIRQMSAHASMAVTFLITRAKKPRENFFSQDSVLSYTFDTSIKFCYPIITDYSKNSFYCLIYKPAIHHTLH